MLWLLLVTPSCYYAVISIDLLVISHILYTCGFFPDNYFPIFVMLMIIIYMAAIICEIAPAVQSRLYRLAFALLSVLLNVFCPLLFIVLAIRKHCRYGCCFFIILQLIIFCLPTVSYAPESRWMELLPLFVVLLFFHAGIIALYYELRRKKGNRIMPKPG